MKVLLLLTIAAVGQCALLGSKKCTYGPSYWCSHIHHARECSAMQHCMTTVWKNQRLGMTGSTETCFDIIKVLDTVRHSNDDDLLEQWAVGCTGMPAEKRQLCKELLKDDMNEVSKLLKSDLSSRQIATALKLCGEFVDAVTHPEQVAGDYCKDCVNFMGDLREIFNNTEGQAEALFKKMVCSQAGPLESLCDQLVEQYGRIVFNMVYQQLNPQRICQALHLCSNQTHADLLKSLKYTLAKKQKGSAECDVCKSLAGDLQSALRDTTLQNDVIAAVEDRVCPILGTLADQCKTYVATYGPVVFQILVAELDPQTICQTLGLCNATKTDSGKLTRVPLGSPVGSVQIKAPEMREETSIKCELCKEVVGMLEKLISDGKAAEEAKAAMEDFCKLLPSEESQKCSSFVEQYGDLIINLLLSEVTPDKVCAILNECPDAKLLHARKFGMPVKGSEECDICKSVMEFVREELNSSEARTVEKEILDEICTKVPSGYKQLCELFVNEYLSDIIDTISKEMDPAKICTAVKLCGQPGSATRDHRLTFQPMVELRPAKPHLLGTNKCLFGPSFWCSSEENAQLCNAVEHCKRMNKLN